MKLYHSFFVFTSADIIERGIREHPELSVGMTTEGIEVRSVGNTLTLHETALIEAFNLKAAIEYQLKNCMYSPPKSLFQMMVYQIHSSCTVLANFFSY